jgi:hypothetical protein
LHDLICIAVALFGERMLATQVIFLCIALFTRTAKMEPFLEKTDRLECSIFFGKNGQIGMFYLF